jgi:enoyl-CoA hydratase
MSSPFRVERDGHVATLFLSNPERRNAMGPEFWAELPPVVEGLDRDAEVRAVVVAADGPHFSVGLDLMRMAAELGPALVDGALAHERRELFRTIGRMRRGFDLMVDSDKPFIAAVHGRCIGGGLDLVAACDMRFASADASFSLREAKVAIVADMGSLQRLAPVIGAGHLRELAFTARDIDAVYAERIGLVNRVLPDQVALLAEAKRVAAEIADNSPLVVQGVKEVLRVSERHGAEVGMRYVAAWNAGMLASHDLREAMGAFMEKRAPKFTGR